MRDTCELFRQLYRREIYIGRITVCVCVCRWGPERGEEEVVACSRWYMRVYVEIRERDQKRERERESKMKRERQ